jgi:hypothetical protein
MSKLKVFKATPEFDSSPLRPLVLSGLDVTVPFCEDVFEITADFASAEIVPFMSGICEYDPVHVKTELSKFDLSGKVFVNISLLMHIGEFQSTEYTQHFHDNLPIHDLFRHISHANRPRVVTLHTNLSYVNDPKFTDILYTDFMWNREVALFVTCPDVIFDSNCTESRNHWYPQSDPVTNKFRKSLYQLYDLDSCCSTEFLDRINNNHILLKKYISPNNTRSAHSHRKYYSGFLSETSAHLDNGIAVRDFLRTELIEKLQRYPGFLGDSAAHNFLVGQNMSDADLDNAISGLSYVMYPLHNSYYQSSVVSVYIESLVITATCNIGRASVRSITEKTWDPLIKGSFILPFGYSGMIRDLSEVYGTKFPEWIDYSYDGVDNDLERWKLYLESVHTLLNLSAETLFRLKIKDKEILKHNRALFFEQQYRHPISSALRTWIAQCSDLAGTDILARLKAALW